MSLEEKEPLIMGENVKNSKKRTRYRKNKKRQNNSDISHDENAYDTNSTEENNPLNSSTDTIKTTCEDAKEKDECISNLDIPQHANNIDDENMSSAVTLSAECCQSIDNKVSQDRKRKNNSDSEILDTLQDSNIHPSKIKKGNENGYQVEHEASLEQNTATEIKDVHTILERKKSNDRSTNCNCTTIERQQREIVSLKRKLQEREVYGPSTKTYSENRAVSNDSDEKLEAMNIKINKMFGIMEEQRKKLNSSYSIESLHSKVDKVVRLLSDVTEIQKKNSRVLQQLQKNNEALALKEHEEIEKLKKTRFSASLPSNLATVASKDSNASKPEDIVLSSPIFTDKKEKDENVENTGMKNSIQPPQPPDPLEELRWGENMVLVGDTFWRSFLRLDDVKTIVDKMESAVKFKINAPKDNEIIKRLYDTKREKILFALPPKVKTIGISIGATDLLEAKGEHIKTLKDGPLAIIKKHNLPTLQYMANSVKSMVQKLLATEKFVLLLIPLYGKERREVFDHWRKVLQDTLEDLPFPSFRILNLQNLMKSTEAQFQSHEQMFSTWLENPVPSESTNRIPEPKIKQLELSAYGTRRLFDALKKAMWATNKKSLETTAYLNSKAPSLAQQKCPRCTRFHTGGADLCKSKDKICRVCGKLGHFVEVHEVHDPAFRQRIIETLGEDIFSQPHLTDDKSNSSNSGISGNIAPKQPSFVEHHCKTPGYTQKVPHSQIQGPLTEKEMLEMNSAQAVLPWNPSRKLDDWYN